MYKDLSFLALGWILWCFIHSILIHPPVIHWLKSTLREKFRYFRLAYNLFAFFSLAPLVVWGESISYPSLFVWEWPWSLIRGLLWAVSFWIFVAGVRSYDMVEFLGLSFIKRRAQETPASISFDGIHRWSRHPWYLAGFMVLWTRHLSPQTLVVNLLLSSYLVVGAHLEEIKLVNEYGESYLQYRKEVSMFIPWRKMRLLLADIFQFRGLP